MQSLYPANPGLFIPDPFCFVRIFKDHCSNSLLPAEGGANRVRTGDLLLAKQALSQLSYGPNYIEGLTPQQLVGLGRFELPTSPLSGVRSNQLSYRPNRLFQ